MIYWSKICVFSAIFTHKSSSSSVVVLPSPIARRYMFVDSPIISLLD